MCRIFPRAPGICLSTSPTLEPVRALSRISVTHLFYTALASQPRLDEEIASNLAMLRNIVETLELGNSELCHIQLMQGNKWYGNHLGPYPTPAREDQPRHSVGIFHYYQQDWLTAQQREQVLYLERPAATRHLGIRRRRQSQHDEYDRHLCRTHEGTG